MFFQKAKKDKDDPILIQKKVHILTLDSRWHELYQNHKKSGKITELEKKLNKLVKEQGQLNNDFKEYSLLKKKMMSDIMENMKEAFDDESNTAINEMGKSKKYINDINSKLEKIEERMTKVPDDIEKNNQELLSYSMQEFYSRMASNKSEMDEFDEWIKKAREELKEKIVRKNEIEEDYQKLYTYMHDLIGHEIIEKYDKKYLGGQNDNRRGE